MIITENLNMNCVLEANVEGNQKGVVSINTNLFENGNNFNINFSIMDKTIVAANTAALQTQMNDFMSALRIKMTELGYVITI